MTPAHVVIVDAVQTGVLLIADGDRLRYKALRQMPADLAERIRTNKRAVLDLLRADETPAPLASAATRSDLAESERCKGRWREDELALLARANPGSTPADLPIVTAVKDAFADLPGGGAIVIAVEPAGPQGDYPGQARHRAARLIREVRRADALIHAGLAVAMRDAWAERIAICTIDGGLTEDAAERVALTELDAMGILDLK